VLLYEETFNINFFGFGFFDSLVGLLVSRIETVRDKEGNKMIDFLLRNIAETDKIEPWAIRRRVFNLAENHAKKMRLSNNFDGLRTMAIQYKSHMFRYFAALEILKLDDIEIASKILIEYFRNYTKNGYDPHLNTIESFLTKHDMCPPDIKAIVAVRKCDWNQAASIGKPAIEQLLTVYGLQSHMYWVVQGAASALTRIGDPLVIPHLVHTLERGYQIMSDDNVTEDDIKTSLSNLIVIFGEVALKDLKNAIKNANPAATKYIQRTIDLIEKK